MTNYFNGYGQAQRPNNEILAVPVHGEVGAQNYPVASGNTVILTDFASGLLWLKSTDANGLFSNLRTFKVEEITPQQKQNGDFVSQSEFTELKNQLNNQFQQIAASLNSLLNRGENQNAKLNGQPATVSSEVQRICEQLSKEQQRNNTTANGSTNA